MKNQNALNLDKLEKFILSIGLNDKDTKKQEISTEKAQEIICVLLLAQGVQGATISNARGFYVHNENARKIPVFENSFKVEILFESAERVLNLCQKIKAALNQESVVIERAISESALV